MKGDLLVGDVIHVFEEAAAVLQQFGGTQQLTQAVVRQLSLANHYNDINNRVQIRMLAYGQWGARTITNVLGAGPRGRYCASIAVFIIIGSSLVARCPIRNQLENTTTNSHEIGTLVFLITA